MLISHDWLVEQGACVEGETWFWSMYGVRPVELKTVLWHLYERARLRPDLGSSYGWPCWLMDSASSAALTECLRTKLASKPSSWRANWVHAKLWCVGEGLSDAASEGPLLRLKTLIDEFLFRYDKGE